MKIFVFAMWFLEYLDRNGERSGRKSADKTGCCPGIAVYIYQKYMEEQKWLLTLSVAPVLH